MGMACYSEFKILWLPLTVSSSELVWIQLIKPLLHTNIASPPNTIRIGYQLSIRFPPIHLCSVGGRVHFWGHPYFRAFTKLLQPIWFHEHRLSYLLLRMLVIVTCSALSNFYDHVTAWNRGTCSPPYCTMCNLLQRSKERISFNKSGYTTLITVSFWAFAKSLDSSY